MDLLSFTLEWSQKMTVEGKKFVSIEFDSKSLKDLMGYVVQNGLDAYTKFDKTKLDSPMTDYHLTVMFSNNAPVIPMENRDHQLPDIEIVPYAFDLFGENKDILVMKIKETDELRELRNLMIEHYGLKDSFPEWSPHVTLTYNYEGNIPKELPKFRIFGSVLKVKDNAF